MLISNKERGKGVIVIKYFALLVEFIINMVSKRVTFEFTRKTEQRVIIKKEAQPPTELPPQ